MTCSPDGRLVGVASRSQVLLLDAASGRTRARLEHRSVINSLAFSPDSARLATGAEDGHAVVYEVASRRAIARMPFPERVQRVEFDPDGRLLRITTGTFRPDYEDMIFRTTLEPIAAVDLVASACGKLTRNLTPEEWSEYFDEPFRDTCPNLAAHAARGTVRARADQDR